MSKYSFLQKWNMVFDKNEGIGLKNRITKDTLYCLENIKIFLVNDYKLEFLKSGKLKIRQNNRRDSP